MLDLVAILLLIGTILAINLVVWAIVFRWLRRRLRGIAAVMARSVLAGGEDMVFPPQEASFRGSTARFGKLKGNGVLCLTDKRLLFDKVIGPRIEIERSAIASVRIADGFRGEWIFAPGKKYLVVDLTDGVQVAFLVKHAENWADFLESRKG